MTIEQVISEQLALPLARVEAVISLLDEGATIPFIARYRKEQTGSMDEVQIALIAQQRERLEALENRKATILSTIDEQGKLTPELEQRIRSCFDAGVLEDLYLPFKPHRKTRADLAREKGLEPLAKQIMAQRGPLPKASEEDLQGARDIVAEWINEDERARAAVRREFQYSAIITSRVVKTKANEPEAQTYRDYFDSSERLSRIQSHRLLAMRRGEKEGFLRVDISPDKDKAMEKLERLFLRSSSEQVRLALEDSYKRLLKPSIETEFSALSKQKADEQAIRVFADNARQLLLAAPLGQKRVLALDPGFRTGCKLVVLSAQGDLLRHDVIYPTPPKNDVAHATRTMVQYIKQFAVEAIAIGNGTASRETESFVREMLRSLDMQDMVSVYVVSESGASVYSASAIAREEFPAEDVTVRGAVSIGRRLMDPLAELVKIDPKSIGVGQYQHDVDQTYLKSALTQTVESVVNYVGVDVNTASKHLLTYVSGLGPAIAQNIVAYRSEHGPFPSRKALLRVPKLGDKIFQQCAGFLRISGGDNPLDNTAVHPERYALAEQLMKAPKPVNLSAFVSEEVGLPTLEDILRELEKPSRDPRGEAEAFHFSEAVHTLDDLLPGMILPGLVTNLTAFGAFIDLGVHQDGLLHISQLRQGGRRVQDASEVLHLGQALEVRVKEVDKQRHRISLEWVQPS